MEAGEGVLGKVEGVHLAFLLELLFLLVMGSFTSKEGNPIHGEKEKGNGGEREERMTV